MAGHVLRLVGGLALVVALTACGDGDSSERAEPEASTTTPTSAEVGSTTAPPTTAKARRPLPGPIVPSTPLAGRVSRWHADLATMTPTSCRRIVDEASTAKGETALDRALILLYRGAGEGCLGRTGQARDRLTQARTALGALPSSQLDLASPRCRPFELLSWAFFTFLDTDIPATCPPPATTSSSSSTSSSTRTSLSATTTRRP